jgi:hypothetical protein
MELTNCQAHANPLMVNKPQAFYGWYKRLVTERMEYQAQIVSARVRSHDQFVGLLKSIHEQMDILDAALNGLPLPRGQQRSKRFKPFHELQNPKVRNQKTRRFECIIVKLICDSQL